MDTLILTTAETLSLKEALQIVERFPNSLWANKAKNGLVQCLKNTDLDVARELA